MLIKKKYYIEGMHCISCELLLEKNLKKVKQIKSVKVSHKSGELEVLFKGKLPEEKIIEAIKECSFDIKDNNNKKEAKVKKADIFQIILISIVLAFIFFLISKMEITRFFPSLSSQVGFFMAFVIGIVASLSSCLALTGGIVMSFSGSYEINKKPSLLQRSIPQLHFHVGRIGAFLILGGILGLIGEKINYSVSFTGYLTLLVAVLMLYIGLHVLNLAPSITKLGIHLPKSFAHKIDSLKEKKHPLVPFFIGALTFFLPCGFTQSMQIAAVASTSFLQGALLMGFFAIGTVPVLFMVGVGSSYSQDRNHHVLKKIIGVLIIFFALYSFNSGLLLSGSSASFGFWNNSEAEQSDINQVDQSSVQVVKMDVDYGFKPNVFRVKKGIPVRWEINVIRASGCSNEVVIPRLNISSGKFKPGLNIVEFTPTQSGTLPFSCWMGMLGGKFIVE